MRPRAKLARFTLYMLGGIGPDTDSPIIGWNLLRLTFVCGLMSTVWFVTNHARKAKARRTDVSDTIGIGMCICSIPSSICMFLEL